MADKATKTVKSQQVKPQTVKPDAQAIPSTKEDAKFVRNDPLVTTEPLVGDPTNADPTFAPHTDAAFEPTSPAASEQAKADDKLLAEPAASAERTAQGDWAKANNPSPQEQAAEADRQAARDRIANR